MDIYSLFLFYTAVCFEKIEWNLKLLYDSIDFSKSEKRRGGGGRPECVYVLSGFHIALSSSQSLVCLDPKDA